MPSGNSGVPNRQNEAAKLRKEAKRARRIAAEMTSLADRQLLSELADKLEAEAAELERDGG